MIKKYKLLSLCLISIFILPLTMAYYTDSFTVENIFNTIKPIGVGIEEIFTPTDDWLPGESRQKEVWFTNPSSSPILIRMKYHEAWFDMNGIESGLDVKNVTKEWTEDFTSDWVYIDGYYYYKKILDGNGQTNPVLNRLILYPVSNDGHGDDYSNKNYKLEFIVEGCRVDRNAVKVLFDIDVSVNGENVDWKEK